MLSVEASSPYSCIYQFSLNLFKLRWKKPVKIGPIKKLNKID